MEEQRNQQVKVSESQKTLKLFAGACGVLSWVHFERALCHNVKNVELALFCFDAQGVLEQALQHGLDMVDVSICSGRKDEDVVHVCEEVLVEHVRR